MIGTKLAHYEITNHLGSGGGPMQNTSPTLSPISITYVFPLPTDNNLD